ncbi:hypothetical protein ACHAXM_001233 [Skeletonema potamos]
MNYSMLPGYLVMVAYPLRDQNDHWHRLNEIGTRRVSLEGLQLMISDDVDEESGKRLVVISPAPNNRPPTVIVNLSASVGSISDNPL